MSPSVWSYVAGGAGDERTQRVNVTAFDRWGLMPRMFVGAKERDLSVDLFGLTLPSPVFMAPIGVIGLCAQDGHGDLATARAAARTGVPMVVVDADRRSDGGRRRRIRRHPRLFPAVHPDRPRPGRQPRAPRRGGRLQGHRRHARHLGARLASPRPVDVELPAAAREVPGQLHQRPGVPRRACRSRPRRTRRRRCCSWVQIFGNPLTWDDLPWLRSLTTLPLIVKGICHPDDARRAIDGGVDGIYCSNHGGRQANGGMPAIDCLPGVVEAADGLPVLFDSGIRSGADIVKALALGATAVGIGRPYAYGLALGGVDGVVHVLRSLLAEADLIMAVDGYPTLKDLTPETLRRVT